MFNYIRNLKRRIMGFIEWLCLPKHSIKVLYLVKDSDMPLHCLLLKKTFIIHKGKLTKGKLLNLIKEKDDSFEPKSGHFIAYKKKFKKFKGIQTEGLDFVIE